MLAMGGVWHEMGMNKTNPCLWGSNKEECHVEKAVFGGADSGTGACPAEDTVD